MKVTSIFALVAISNQQAVNAFTVFSPVNTNNVLPQINSNTIPIPSTNEISLLSSLSLPIRKKGNSNCILYAGGFEWEDPAEEFDQGVENPYENPELNLLINSSSNDSSATDDGSSNNEDGGESLKIDPARLLGPRLNGSNLYFVGMMGSGKSAVGDVVARSKLLRFRFIIVKKQDYTLLVWFLAPTLVLISSNGRLKSIFYQNSIFILIHTTTSLQEWDLTTSLILTTLSKKQHP